MVYHVPGIPYRYTKPCTTSDGIQNHVYDGIRNHVKRVMVYKKTFIPNNGTFGSIQDISQRCTTYSGVCTMCVHDDSFQARYTPTEEK